MCMEAIRRGTALAVSAVQGDRGEIRNIKGLIPNFHRGISRREYDDTELTASWFRHMRQGHQDPDTDTFWQAYVRLPRQDSDDD